MRNVIAKISTGTVILLIAAGSLFAADPEPAGLEEKLDSLFIIASSGEVRYRDMNEPAMDSIAAYGVEAVPFLIEKFKTKSARERWTVIWTLERIGSPAVPDLVAALKRPDDLIVQRVCWALGDIGDTAAVVPLIAVSDKESWQVRDQAITALGKIGDERGSETVSAALADTIGQVRKSAAVACRKLQVPLIEAELVHMLGDDFYGARLEAFEALLPMDTAQTIDVLRDSLFSPNPYVGYLGCDLLGRLAGDTAIMLLFQMVGSPDLEMQAHAGVALVVADPRNVSNIQERLLNEVTDRLVRLKIESAIRTYTTQDDL